MSLIKSLAALIERQIVDDEYRNHITTIGLCLLFTIVAVVMCLVNLITKQYVLFTAVLIFGIISLSISILNIFVPKSQKVCEIIFMVSSISLFTFFLITGGVQTDGANDVPSEGFSTYWILIVPMLGMLAFGLLKGTIYSGVMFLILIIFLWTPLGDLIRNIDFLKDKVDWDLIYIKGSIALAFGFFSKIVFSMYNKSEEERAEEEFYKEKKRVNYSPSTTSSSIFKMFILSASNATTVSLLLITIPSIPKFFLTLSKNFFLS